MRVIASQKLPRDSGESLFAAGHQDASQGPLGKNLLRLFWWTFRIFLISSDRGRGRGSPRRREGAGRFFIQKFKVISNFGGYLNLLRLFDKNNLKR